MASGRRVDRAAVMAAFFHRSQSRMKGAGAAGFTLIELITVMLLVAILAVIAIPRLDTQMFDARAFHESTQAYLRYAHKAAIAQRRTVCVTFTVNSLTLAMAAAAATPNCVAASVLTGPAGVAPPVLVAPAGVTYTAVPMAFNFDGLGQPIDGGGATLATQTLQVNGVAATVIVEAITGYVHD